MEMVDMRRRAEDRMYGITTEPARLFFFSVSEHGCHAQVRRQWGKGAGLRSTRSITHQSDDAVVLLHLLPEVLEAGDQAVVQRLQLLRRLLAVDADSLRQQGDLQRTASVTELARLTGQKTHGGGRGHLQGDEVFQNLDALQVLRVLLDVGVREEGLWRSRNLSQSWPLPHGERQPQTFS